MGGVSYIAHLIGGVKLYRSFVLLLGFHLHYGDLTDSSSMVKLISEVSQARIKLFSKYIILLIL